MLLAEEQELARVEAKAQRSRDKKAAKRAQELTKLKAHINSEFVRKARVEEGIVLQEIVDIDGHG